MNDAAPKINFDALTKKQQDVLGHIAINEDGGHNPRTLQSLLRMELIKARDTIERGVRITHYYVPTWVHIQWCEWCSTKVKEDEDAQ